jgi:prephenate dehydratase
MIGAFLIGAEILLLLYVIDYVRKTVALNQELQYHRLITTSIKKYTKKELSSLISIIPIQYNKQVWIYMFFIEIEGQKTKQVVYVVFDEKEQVVFKYVV